jgi:hypothetical protein
MDEAIFLGVAVDVKPPAARTVSVRAATAGLSPR